MKTDRAIALVIGDVTVDWNLARVTDQERESTWANPEQRIQMKQAPGGAALLAEIVAKTASGLPWKVIGPAMDKGCDHLYRIWSRTTESERPSKSDPWRVAEVLGTKKGETGTGAGLPSFPDSPALLVIDDKARGFRDRRKVWQPVLEAVARMNGWIVWRVSRPLGENALWRELLDKYCDRLIAITTAGDVRQAEVQVSRELSWESSALDLYRELTGESEIGELANCAFTIVCFSTDGALILPGDSRDNSPTPPCQLVFDPLTQERDLHRAGRGYVLGNTYCIVAAICRGVMETISGGALAGSLTSATKRGLRGARELHSRGYRYDRRDGLHFPTDIVARAVTDGPLDGWVAVELPLLRGTTNTITQSWTILGATSAGTLSERARDIAVKGVDCVQSSVPVLRFGEKFAVLDRREIEGYRSIQRLIADYATSKRSKPLSIAVFGPPGSGKSFGITNVAEAMFDGSSVDVLTFNLSQFSGPEDLRGALHQVRDSCLRGKLPLVFWDEFDSTAFGHELGWLPFFLAPMQDGTFQDGQITHPTGASVFVFAGGTSPSFTAFAKAAKERPDVKGPDFISRLLGFLDVVGINPAPAADEDPGYVVRRAVLLHSLLTKHCPRLRHGTQFNVDPGVVHAFLHIPEYRHGARSMEAVISMSTLVDLARYERSSLPSEAQLNLHVDGREFRRLIESIRNVI